VLFQNELSLLVLPSCHWWHFTQRIINFYRNLIPFQLKVQVNEATTLHK